MNYLPKELRQIFLVYCRFYERAILINGSSLESFWAHFIYCGETELLKLVIHTVPKKLFHDLTKYAVMSGSPTMVRYVVSRLESPLPVDFFHTIGYTGYLYLLDTFTLPYRRAYIDREICESFHRLCSDKSRLTHILRILDILILGKCLTYWETEMFKYHISVLRVLRKHLGVYPHTINFIQDEYDEETIRFIFIDEAGMRAKLIMRALSGIITNCKITDSLIAQLNKITQN